MNRPSLLKAGILTLVLVSISVAVWELYLRSINDNVSYDDGKELWSYQRGRVYTPSDKATVFIGSSRNKYDIDIATWKEMTGEDVIQLSIEGASPTPVLENLANDTKFKGKLIVDVTEGLFYSTGFSSLVDPRSRVDHFKKITPAQKISFQLNRVLESKLVFLDKDFYSLNALLSNTDLPNRKGVFVMPIFPRDFGLVHFNRQVYMTDRFIGDTNLQNQVKAIWNFFRSISTERPATGGKLDSMMTVIKTQVDKIKARGGQVLFIRTPSSGPFFQGEMMGFPRAQYWDRLLSVTGCPGIHFKDYSATANFECPEFSHLKPVDAIVYTKSVVEALQKEKGWVFPYAPRQ
jgi:hypothetical protein